MSAALQAEPICAEVLPDVVEALGQDRAPQTTGSDGLRIFLVACHQAGVSVETMSRYLGLEGDCVRVELLRGIEAWNAGQRRYNEVGAGAV